ncbi:PH domain-containing protein [Microbacterium limosum]|uniref:PH domain-containing protein n=1 Tax=Microbacterium limosum TaxID=3079935 RepID=A0AAU0MJF4_9MICO|nr:PH domain-containing protein [Microbacterium sp. Y20]WOQ70286.1 PH domain-containing protein [Microbacterium sp. Y20]
MRRATPTPEGRVFRTPSGVVAFVVAAAVAALLLGDAAVRAGVGEMLLLAPWILLLLWGAYVFVYAPRVRIDRDGIRLHNILRIIDVPWALVRGIDVRWQLELTLHDGRVLRAYGGPVAGRPGRPALRRSPGEAERVPPAVRDLALIREQWQDALEQGADSAAPEIRRGWDVPGLVALAAILAWAVIALLISGGTS